MPTIINKVLQTAKKEKLFTVSNLIVMTLTFLVFGLFVCLEVFSQTALSKLEKEAVVTIFFKDEVTPQKIQELKSIIERDTRVYSVEYISKEDAFVIFKDLNKNEPLLLESVTANVLPASLEIRAVKVSSLNTLAQEYTKIEGVEGVKFFKDIIERFNFWRGVLSGVVGVVLLILLFVSFSIVVSTVRTAISLRGTEFEILKLVGASDSFVKTPLLYQGILYGSISAFLASAFYALLLILGTVTGVLRNLGIANLVLMFNVSLPAWAFALMLVVFLTLCGALLGHLSSTSAVKKYLNY